MNILVTGANGFVGQELIRILAKTQHRICGLDLEPGKAVLPKIFEKFYVQDITKKFNLNQSFDVVFHLAACNLTHVGKADRQKYYDVNAEGTKNLIESSKIRKFVFLSTAKVYQLLPGEINEASPVSPLSDYEKSKLEAEDVCRQYFSDDDLTIFRSVNIVGERQAEKAVIPVFFKNALAGKPLEIIGSGRTKAQLLYIEDLLDAVTLILNREKGCGIVNLAGEESIEILKLAEKVIDICRSASKIICTNTDAVIFPEISAEKIKRILGWQAKISVDEMLKRYFNFLRNNG
ncbi:MAG TPA: NAD(P)-dependent oxidoreductase [Candidatus Omnitrophota bacterium]|nr:NAD(P)-dependent oxidoreductase [Candidatus Omnitrophota bacterium]HPD84084.1 NAD(P)-dependent oxidoreductase [Candidatus Omnitrophota bacterium]HRZ02941.1 NAD(P)-dependent oxidoreductase [Candidatus Omnitrophota bacterium]